MDKRGNSTVILLMVIFVLFVLITAGMFFLLPRKDMTKKVDKAEIEKKVLKYSPAEIEELNAAIREREALLAQKEKIVKEQEERINMLNKEGK